MQILQADFGAEESAIRMSGNAPNYLPRLIRMEISIYETLKTKTRKTKQKPNKKIPQQ